MNIVYKVSTFLENMGILVNLTAVRKVSWRKSRRRKLFISSFTFAVYTTVQSHCECMFITSAREVMFTRRLSVCLSVCLLATSCKNYWLDLHANFTVFDKDKSPLNFGSRLYLKAIYGLPKFNRDLSLSKMVKFS